MKDAVTTALRRVRNEARKDVGRSRPSRAEVLATVLTLAAMLAVASLRHERFATPAGWLLAATLVAWFPLLWRTRFPLRVLTAVVAAESFHLAVIPYAAPNADHPVEIIGFQPVPLATMAAVWTVVTRTPRLLGWVSAALAASTLLIVALLSRPLHMLGTDVVVFDLVLITAGVATVVASSRERAERRQRDHARLVAQAVTDERLRIAWELHDVLAHNLALVNAQAGVAEYLMTSNADAAAAALRGITDHTSRALDELRATVGLLRREPDLSAPDRTTPGAAHPPHDSLTPEQLHPVPGLARLEDLLDTFRSTGTDVTVTTSGTAVPLEEHSDLAAYRIIQEAVTNAAKHAPGQPVRVDLQWQGERNLALRVTNPLTALRSTRRAGASTDSAARRPVGTGHGLIGMRERARTAGGTFCVTTTADSHVVEATLPQALRTHRS